MNKIQTAGIIGAGISGLACAKNLHSAGVEVTILEKSRGVGGRVATRRIDSGVTFDHGAQYFTVRDSVFAATVKQWCAAGTAKIWNERIVILEQGVATELHEPRERYVGVPGMNAIAKSLASGVAVRTNITAENIRQADGRWLVLDSAGTEHGPFDLLISTAPPPQTIKLLGGQSATLENSVSSVTMDPCWTVMLQMSEPLELGYDAAFVHDSPLSWIARNSSKPERGATDTWVLQATADWSNAHLEDSGETVAKTLVEEFWQVTSQLPRSLELVTAHRWRYALPREPLPQRYLLDGEMNLAVCGDWCGGPRVEGAYLSGLALAEAVLGMSKIPD